MSSENESDVELEGVDMDEDEDQPEEEDQAFEPEEPEPAKPPAPPVPPPKATTTKGGRKESKEWQEARKAQKEKLANMRAMGTTGVKMTREKRLAYLMAQSEIFAHFTDDSGAPSNDRKKKTGRTKLSEAAEDATLMKTAQSKLRVHRVEKQPAKIKATLRPYQLEGLNWLVRLHDNGINGILADEMGLGKTLQTISLIAYLSENRDMAGPHLCVVPKSVVNNWIREFRKWSPSTRTIKLLGSKEERARVVREELVPGFSDVCVTSYEGVLKEKSTLCKFDWQYLVIDEAHRIKNPKSSLSKVVRIIPTQFRLLITGTPLQNNLNELWALLNFLLPDIFASEADFESWFSIDTGDDDAKENVVKKLHTVLRPFMLRRIKKDVETDLPPKREVKLYIGLTEMQRLWYTKILSKDAHTLNALGGPDRVQLLNILMQLRKVCNHPYLFEGAEPGPPYVDGPHLWENTGKLVLLTKLLPKLKKQKSRVLIFSQMTRMLDILEDYMRLNEHPYCRIDGSTHGDDRDAQMDEFNEPGSSKFVFLLSTRAGGLGINLATADIVVLYDSDWNPQVDLQAMDRAHRIGQTKPVTVFRFVTEGTVEEKIIERADRKLFLDAAVIQQGRLAEQNAAMSKSDLMAMVRFGADEIFSSKTKTLTDEDIDTLLKRGEERTQSEAAKIQSDVQHNLADFSLTTKDAEESLFNFDGVDFRDEHQKGLFINLPQRERKRNYDVDEYFRDALRQGQDPNGGGSANKPKLPMTTETAAQKAIKERRKGLPPMHDFQFFDRKNLDKLLAVEDDLALKRHESASLVKELRQQALKSAESDDQAASLQARADDLEAKLDVDFELNDADAERKKHLLAEGFGDWTRKDLRAFLSATERRGRDDVTNVASDVASETGKPAEEVERYHAAFWARFREIAEWEKFIDKIEKGERRLQRNKEIERALAAKVARHDKPWQCLPLNYGASKGKVWTEVEDAFLVTMMHTYGYGNWERIRVEIRKAWEFNFDWFFKSRSSQDLQRRAELLIRLVEKENEEFDKGAAAETYKDNNADADGAKNIASSGKKKPAKRKASASPPSSVGAPATSSKKAKTGRGRGRPPLATPSARASPASLPPPEETPLPPPADDYFMDDDDDDDDEDEEDVEDARGDLEEDDDDDDDNDDDDDYAGGHGQQHDDVADDDDDNMDDEDDDDDDDM